MGGDPGRSTGSANCRARALLGPSRRAARPANIAISQCRGHRPASPSADKRADEVRGSGRWRRSGARERPAAALVLAAGFSAAASTKTPDRSPKRPSSSDASQLSVDIARIRLAPLAPHAIDPAKGRRSNRRGDPGGAQQPRSGGQTRGGARRRGPGLLRRPAARSAAVAERRRAGESAGRDDRIRDHALDRLPGADDPRRVAARGQGRGETGQPRPAVERVEHRPAGAPGRRRRADRRAEGHGAGADGRRTGRARAAVRPGAGAP